MIDKELFKKQCEELIEYEDKETEFSKVVELYINCYCMLTKASEVVNIALRYLLTSTFEMSLEEAKEEADWFQCETDWGRGKMRGQPYIIKIERPNEQGDFCIDSIDAYWEYLVHEYGLRTTNQ